MNEQKVKIVDSGMWVIIFFLLFIFLSINIIQGENEKQTKILEQIATKQCN